jgi:hypothetical protein
MCSCVRLIGNAEWEGVLQFVRCSLRWSSGGGKEKGAKGHNPDRIGHLSFVDL